MARRTKMLPRGRGGVRWWKEQTRFGIFRPRLDFLLQHSFAGCDLVQVC